MNEQSGSSSDQSDDSQREAFSGTHERRRPRPGVPTWEYMNWIVGQQSTSTWVVVYVNGNHERRANNTLPAALADAGAVGWDLVAVHAIGDDKASYIFKRPKAED